MSIQFNSIQNLNNEDSCPICQEEMQNGLVSHEIDNKVQHVFHEACLRPWLQTHASCPLCRLNVNSLNGQVVAKPLMTDEILMAVMNNDEILLGQLLERGSMTDDDRGMALCYAAKAGSQAIVRALMENGSISQGFLRNALLGSIRNNSLEMAVLLIENNSISEESYSTLIQEAIKLRNVELVHLLIDKGTLAGYNLDSSRAKLKKCMVLDMAYAAVLPIIGVGLGMLIKTAQEALGI